MLSFFYFGFQTAKAAEEAINNHHIITTIGEMRFHLPKNIFQFEY